MPCLMHTGPSLPRHAWFCITESLACIWAISHLSVAHKHAVCIILCYRNLSSQAQISTTSQHLLTCSTSFGRASLAILLTSDLHSYHPPHKFRLIILAGLVQIYLYFNCFLDMLWWTIHFKSCWKSLLLLCCLLWVNHLFTSKSMEGLIDIR